MANRFKPYLTPALGIVALGLFALNFHQYVRQLTAPRMPASLIITTQPLPIYPRTPSTHRFVPRGEGRYELRLQRPDTEERLRFELRRHEHRNEHRVHMRGDGMATIAWDGV